MDIFPKTVHIEMDMSSSLPSLPTDNLYKFCAIAGLLIIGAFIYFKVTKTAEFHRRDIAVKLMIRKSEIEADLLKALIKDDEKEERDLSDPAHATGAIKAETTGAEFARKVEHHRELQRDLGVRLAEANSANEELSAIGQEVEVIRKYGIGGCLSEPLSPLSVS